MRCASAILGLFLALCLATVIAQAVMGVVRVVERTADQRDAFSHIEGGHP